MSEVGEIIKFLHAHGHHAAGDFLHSSRPFDSELGQDSPAVIAVDKGSVAGDAMAFMLHGSARLKADGPAVARGQERLPPADLGMFSLYGLQTAVDARAVHIDPEGRLGALFFATELGGEVGEALNVVKKLERERLDIGGSLDTVDHLGKELADTIITACNLARCYGINLHRAIVETFNRTSDERKLPVHLK